MWTWFDGHLVLAAPVCLLVSWAIVQGINLILRQRQQARYRALFGRVR